MAIFVMSLGSPAHAEEHSVYDYETQDENLDYKKKKKRKVTPFNNWNDSFKRWGRGRGAWDNWRDWRDTFKDDPWDAFNDAATDFTSDIMGDVVADIDFEIWVNMNFKTDNWFDLKKEDKAKVYKYWKNRIEPYYDYEYGYHNYHDYYDGPYNEPYFPGDYIDEEYYPGAYTAPEYQDAHDYHTGTEYYQPGIDEAYSAQHNEAYDVQEYNSAEGAYSDYGQSYEDYSEQP